jgi:N-acetylglucosamine-6-phosphate deacetylase
MTQVGSIATMDACVRRYAAATGLPLPAAAACASAAAARLLGLEGKKGSLCVGCDADLVVLDELGQVCVMFITVTIAIITIITGPHHRHCR